jgi:hypothetical protein
MFTPVTIPTQPIVNAAAADTQNIGDGFRAIVLFFNRSNRNPP